MSQAENFNGFITPDGELISIEDVDRMLSVISRRTEIRDEVVGMLWGLARECFDEGHFRAASGYCERIFALMDTPSEKAECLLTMGQAWEQSGDHKAALEAYSGAFEISQEPNVV